VSDRVTIRSTDGLSLEAELDSPANAKAGLVFCHPHPKMGGTMNAPLILAVRDEMVDRGWAVLRFNFRGIGESEGETSLGIDEVADARGAVEKLRGEQPDSPIAIAGWSFGAAVAVRTAGEEPGLAACVGIAPSVKEREGITAGLPSPDEVKLEMPVLFVCGANDELVAPADCRSWIEDHPNGTYVEVPGANHFFWAKYDRLAAIVGDFLDGAIDARKGER
jgi:uncharacterized protein